MIIGHLGPRTNSEIAAEEYFGVVRDTYYGRDIDELISSLHIENSHRIVIPVENSLTGDIGGNKKRVDDLIKKVGEIEIPIHHYLVSDNGIYSLVRSHKEVLKQCDDYLKDKFPGISRAEADSTDVASYYVSMEGGMAITTQASYRYHGLNLLEEIDIGENFTTFWILEKGNR